MTIEYIENSWKNNIVRKGYYKMAKLKREKKPKKLKAQKPPKPKKEKKPKQKKEKKPKKKKGGDEEEGGGKKSKKKILLIVLIMVLLTSAAIAFFIVKNKGKNVVVDTYAIGEDVVSSITTVVGERKMKETVVYELDGITKQEYIYKTDENTEADLEAYQTYLLDEAGFIEIEAEQNAEETKDVEENKDKDKKTEEKDTDQEKKEEAENTAAVENFSYAVASVEKGFVFQLDIALLEDQYAITVSKYEGEDPKAKKEKAEKEQVQQGFTRDQASGSFDTFIDNLGVLPKPIAEYTKIFDVGQAYINNELCYGITVYEKDTNQQNNFVDKYYVSLQSQNIYHYDNQTGNSTLVTPPQTIQPTTPKMDETEETEKTEDTKEKEQKTKHTEEKDKKDSEEDNERVN